VRLLETSIELGTRSNNVFYSRITRNADCAFPLQRNNGKLRRFSHSHRLRVGFGDLGKRKISCPCRKWNHRSSFAPSVAKEVHRLRYENIFLLIYIYIYIYGLLRSWARIPPGALMSVCYEYLCCQVEVSATS
jgi:hypothetical protein